MSIMPNKSTLVLGASEKQERYSNKAIRMLRKHNYQVVAIGNRKGKVDDVEIETDKIPYENIDTVTMYLGADRQKEYLDYIISLKPKRIIYNPGAENEELSQMATEAGIENLEACTLVLLSTNQY